MLQCQNYVWLVIKQLLAAVRQQMGWQLQAQLGSRLSISKSVAEDNRFADANAGLLSMTKGVIAVSCVCAKAGIDNKELDFTAGQSGCRCHLETPRVTP